MMPAIPQRQEDDQAFEPPQQTPEDYYSALVSAVAEAATDPARVRKLVYAVVRSNLNPEHVFSPVLTDATWHAKTLHELDQAFQIERAIRRLEARTESLPASAQAAAFATDTFEIPAFELLHVPAIPDAAAENTRQRPSRAAGAALNRQPAWLTPATRVLSERDNPQGPRLWSAWAGLPTHVHVVVAALIAASVITGVSGMIQRSRGAVKVDTAEVPAPAPAVSVAPKGSKITETVGHAAAPIAGVEPDAASYPVPQNFGVYAVHNGLMSQLDQLPLPIAMARMPASAEIAQPSRTVLAGDRLSFVVLDRDFANSPPETVSVRVVGRVTRLVRYVDGRVRVTPHAGSWRVRDKSYQLKVSPLEGRDILVIGPDAGVMLPAGRYALVLNGRGYDFTVAGRITAPEQCLEQTEVVNGVVVGDCTNL